MHNYRQDAETYIRWQDPAQQTEAVNNRNKLVNTGDRRVDNNHESWMISRL